MREDPIVAEVRAAREAIAKRFGYDLRKIVAYYQSKERQRKASGSQATTAAQPKRASTKPKPKRKRPAA